MKKYLIWGTGKIAERNLKRFKLMYTNKEAEIIGFIDNNSSKWNTKFYGYSVYSPQDIHSLDFDYIDLWFIRDKDVVKQQLTEELTIDKSLIHNAFNVIIERLREKYKGINNDEINCYLERMESSKELGVYYYNADHIDEKREAFYDSEKDLYYTFFEHKRMYFSRKYNGYMYVSGKRYVEHIWQEQDKNSPHLYEEDEVIVQKGDIIVDAGVCEGNFALHHIDDAQKIYLIECDSDWMEALQATFEPYKEKVVFCNKFLSNKDSDTCITLNTLVKEPINFFKMDIEGEEINALKGADRVLTKSPSVKCAICSYHRHGDQENIQKILNLCGLKTFTSKGYMFFIWDDEIWVNPELRRGIVRGYKINENE